jgi:hypothetical protein
MPTVDLPADELAAVAAVIRAFIEGDKFPHAPRLDPLRAALARLDTAGGRAENSSRAGKSSPEPKASPAAKADKRARSAKAPEPKISPGFKLGRLPPDRARR